MSYTIDFAATMQPGLAYIYGQTQIPAAYPLAMAALESGWGTAGNSDFALETNPWGVTASCLGYPALQPSQTGAAVPLVQYPSVLDAAKDFALFVNPSSGCNGSYYAPAWAVRTDGAAWVQALASLGWAGAGNTTWAPDVLALVPQAQAALQAIGADAVTGAIGGSGGGGGGGGILASVPAPAVGVGAVLLLVGAFAAIEIGAAEWVRGG